MKTKSMKRLSVEKIFGAFQNKVKIEIFLEGNILIKKFKYYFIYKIIIEERKIKFHITVVSVNKNWMIVMQKKFVLELVKKTYNYCVYACCTIYGMYIPKSTLPEPIPKEITVTIKMNP